MIYVLNNKVFKDFLINRKIPYKYLRIIKKYSLLDQYHGRLK